MRSLFFISPSLHNHPRSNRPTAARNEPSPASCTCAPPAPLPSFAFRRPPAPRSRAYRTPAHCHPLPGRPPCRAPIPASRRRRLTRVALRRPHRAHRAPTSASPPPSLSSRCGGPRALAGKNRAVCIPFSPNARKRPPFLATSARNACFSRSEWQHPRPMHPFPGAIGRFGIHGARILPPRALFRVEEPEITHGAKMLPAPPGLSAAAACSPAERALRPAARAWPACCMRPPVISLVPAAACAPCHLACARRRPRSSPPSYTRRASPPASRPRTPPSAAPPIAVGMSCRSGSSCRPRAAHADASRHLRAAPIPPAARTHRVQETSGTTQTTQCGHKNRIPKWGPH